MEWEGYTGYELDLNPLSCHDISEDMSVRHLFCSECGTAIFLEKDSTSSNLSVPVSLLKNASDIVDIVGHEWVSNTIDGGASGRIDEVDGAHMPK